MDRPPEPSWIQRNPWFDPLTIVAAVVHLVPLFLILFFCVAIMAKGCAREYDSPPPKQKHRR